MNKTWLGLFILLLFTQSPVGEPPENGRQGIYLVLLKRASVVEEVLKWSADESLPIRREALTAADATSYRDSLERDQLQLIDRLAKRDDAQYLSVTSAAEDRLEVVTRRNFLTNVLIIRASESAIDRLRLDSSVKEVRKAEDRFPLLDTAPQVVNAPTYWAAIPGGLQNAGRGVKIGIIDSGINQEHTMFAGLGLTPPPGFPGGNLSYTNNKVIVARSYHDLFLNTQGNQTPEDEIGHGSRVAAVAAGRQVDAPLARVQGLAPMAFLGNYKVFGTPGLNSTSNSAAIIAALNDAVEDGMDIINLSLGGAAVDPAMDPEQQAIALAVQVGVVVVIAAGNEGPAAGTINSPGTSPEAITVGAVTNGRVFRPSLVIFANPSPPQELAQLAYLPGSGVSIPVAIGPLSVTSLKPLDSSELACEPLATGVLDGQIVLVRRGDCLFQEKADHVFGAGGTAMVVYNNEDGESLVMGFDEQRGAGGPAVMIDKSEGERLRDFLLDNMGVTATLQSEDDLKRFPSDEVTLTGFSSRGPSIDLSVKPDLSAVGSGIYSASKDGSEFTLDSSGTSFSSPMVAGAAALILQLHPEWTPKTVKSALVGTASKQITWEGEPARVNLTGNGRLDLANALQVTVGADPVSVSYGVLKGPASLETELTRTVELKNLTADERVFDFEVVETILNDSVRLTVDPPSVSLAPQEISWIEISFLSLPPLVDGTYEGYLQIRDRDTGSELTLPYWGGIEATDQVEILEVSKSSPGAFRELTTALQTAHPGSVIEISDSSTYAGPLDIHFNEQGLPLDGITIRSVSGADPVIDGSGTAEDSAVVSVRNLRNVTIEGLEITGGLHGIEFTNSTGVLRDNRITSSHQAPSGFGVHLSSSSVHLVENEILQPWESAISAFGSDVLIQRNVIGESGSEELNSGSGITGSSGTVLAIFDNFIGGSRPGLRIADATALVTGNIITGGLEDGIQATGSSSLLHTRDNLITDNQKSGVFLSAGANAMILRDRLFRNQDTGVLIEAQSSLMATALELRQNGSGLQLFDSSGVVTDSVLAFSSSEGILSRRSALDVTNCTLIGNAGRGLEVISPGKTYISNSILFGNQKGSLSGLQGSGVVNNLVGDGQFSNTNGNFSGNPELEDPPRFLFAPQEGSPAVDSGDNTLVVTQADLFSHERIVDGTGDGVAVVDLGAIESASHFAKSLIAPVFSVQPEQWVGLAVTNAQRFPTIDEAPVEGRPDISEMLLKIRNRQGQRVEDRELTVPRHTQKSWLLAEHFEDLQEGWIELMPTGPDAVSFALLGNWETSILDGVPLIPAPGSEVIFPEIRNESPETTTFFLVNPNELAIAVSLTWKRFGVPDLEVSSLLPAKGMLKSTVRDLFGSGSGGYVVAESSPGLPVYGVELFGTSETLGALVALDSRAGEKELYAAQLASSSNVTTILNVINTGPDKVEITLDAVTEHGDILSTVTQSLSPGAQLRSSAREIFDFEAPIEGWMRVMSTSANLLGALAFESPSGEWLTALPLQAEGAREFILSHVAHTPSIFTGVALLNTTPRNALVSFEILDTAGKIIGASYTQLPAFSKRAQLLNEWVTSVEEQSGGFIRIRSDVQIFGFELFGSYNLDYMSAVPQQITVH